MKNELKATSTDEAASECYALVFDSDIDAIRLKNIRAVIAIGRLTREQYCCISDEFNRHYTGMKRVNFILEQTDYAHTLSDIPKGVTCYTTDELLNEVLHKQNELLNILKPIAEVLFPALHKIGKGVYSDVLRALVDANHPDPKYGHWAKWKNGIGYMEIAKSENPKWVEEYGEKIAQQKYAAEAEKIRKQVERMEQKIQEQESGIPLKKTAKKITKKTTKKTAKQKRKKTQTATKVRKTKG